MKKLLLLAFTTISFSLTAQVGIGTTNPHDSSILDIESTTKGLLPPRMTEVQMNAITAPAEGLIVYCLDCAPVGLNVFDGANWNAIGAASVSADCSTNGFTGTYISGVTLSDAKFSVTITNNSFSTAGISFATGDLVLSGVAGITVASVTPASVTLSAGQSQLVEYTLSGTPPTTGTLTGTWTKLALNCTKTRNVANGDATFLVAQNNGYVFSANDISIPLDVQGELAIGTTINVPYTSGIGTYDAYTSPDVSIPAEFSEDGESDWTLGYSYGAGTFATSGNILVTLITKKAGVVTAWPAKRVANIATINFNCVEVPWMLNGNEYSNTVGLHEGGDAIRGAIALGGDVSGAAYDAANINDYVIVTKGEYEKLSDIVVGIENYGQKDVDRLTLTHNPGTYTSSWVSRMMINDIPTTAIPFAFMVECRFVNHCVGLLKQTNTIGSTSMVPWTPNPINANNLANTRIYVVLKRPDIYMPTNTNIAVQGSYGFGSVGVGSGLDHSISSTFTGGGGTTSESSLNGNCTLNNGTISSIPSIGTPASNIYLNYQIRWTSTKSW